MCYSLYKRFQRVIDISTSVYPEEVSKGILLIHNILKITRKTDRQVISFTMKVNYVKLIRCRKQNSKSNHVETISRVSRSCGARDKLKELHLSLFFMDVVKGE
jgi:signal recognition particle receptor subunit beta